MKTATVFLLAYAMASFSAVLAQPRRIIDLSGTWEISEGTLETIPDRFDHHAPVPGLADMAHPPFAEVGVKEERDPRRDAFWYRRTFTFPDTLPAFALLKVNKAMYGTRVYLNGRMAGEHMPSFTPGYFDLRPYLRGNGAPNELIICVGASRSAIPVQYMDGHDYEKLRYIPGIYDDVELICGGTAHIVRVQTVPDIDNSTVRVVTLLENAGQNATSCQIRYQVYEAMGGRIVAEATSDAVQIGARSKQTVETRISLPGAHLWSPEDPFLYELDASIGSDSVHVRFGMRLFHFDSRSGRAVLNNRPYYLRGTNITILRFFEDPLRGDLPWRQEWVRKVIRAFKSMHWNSARFCIGFPPEIWYSIADEEGLLIQDEAPIWLNEGMKQREQITAAALTEEFTEWLQERWNHPSVVIWDAQNESERWEITGQAIQRVRGLDLSDRPWDNGWSPRQEENDPVETHTYFFTHLRFTIPRLACETGEGFLFHWVPGPRIGAVILNEYNWTWLNRNGTPTTLSRDYRVYERIRPDIKAWTPDLYREENARTVAQLTEFFRGHRKLAGVMHFCGLGYSRPNGQTSDEFIDLENAIIEPHFAKYVRDAFAPVGLMINFWTDHVDPGTAQKITVVVINDLYNDWNGAVSFRVTQGNQTVAEQSQAITVPALGEHIVTFDFKAPVATGRYQMIAELRNTGEEPVQSFRSFEVGTTPKRERQSLSGVLTASSYKGIYRPELAGDADETTRWASEYADKQWITIDLGKAARINRVELDWGLEYAESYSIEVSSDGKEWEEISQPKAGKFGVDEITFPATVARFVRMVGRSRATRWGYSLYSFNVYPAE